MAKASRRVVRAGSIPKWPKQPVPSKAKRRVSVNPLLSWLMKRAQ